MAVIQQTLAGFSADQAVDLSSRTAQARLRSGRYRVLFVATDAAGNASAEVRRRFQVDRG